MHFNREVLQALAAVVTIFTACLMFVRQRRGYVLFHAAVLYKLAEVESTTQQAAGQHGLHCMVSKTSKMQVTRKEKPKFKKDPELELDDNTIFPYPCIDEN